ncbi:mechanosensitive ion channel [Phenylobacterium terrae]|uniref:Small-conductance mechanosensitive channel n=1 Tax=Phenylobacterium terrae TaxID=2665495 RepID=A0ABW4N6R9_9CAUL
MPTGGYYDVQDILLEWGPRILTAIAVVIAAHFLAKGVQWGMAKLIDRFPGIRAHNRDAGPKETIGFQLGQLGYWLVLLIGVIAALTILELDDVVIPLSTLITDILAFVPNIIGAGVIFVVGLVVATLARRVVEAALTAAHVDGWLERAGLSRITGASGLAKTIGTLVFVLIVIPVTIAALEQLQIEAISAPAVAVLQTVLSALPRVLAAAIVLSLAFFIGRWVAGLIEQILPSLGFDRSLQSLGVKAAEISPPGDADAPVDQQAAAEDAGAVRTTPSKVVAQLVLVAIMLFSAIEAARLLEFVAIADILQQVLDLAGHVLFGGVIITVGVLLANFLARMIDRSTGGADAFASSIVRWATIALATAMGLRFMGIADEIVILAFGLILGSAAVAAALAFGLGGREAASKLLDRWTRKGDRPPNDLV